MTEKTDVPLRADARRNIDALLKAALTVFGELGVDAPMRTIATRAGVGVGTLYRHFPQRSDLIKAIIRREVEALVDAATDPVEHAGPGAALAAWLNRLVDLVATKRGLGPALHSGDPAYQSLPDFVFGALTPALGALLASGVEAGIIRDDVDASDLLQAVLRVAAPAREGNVTQAKRMVALLIDGLHRSNAV
ncbi:TetR/AcrR family transcriptional regulator [Sphingobium amiense]|uniref:TetR/AcrR family transcriptional regulator n=1 Tax=Sphingobium amiense TaxID=135719 RepID=A0A494W4Z8_9SPHN|nr:TetR/AcrR family transcriptional regulator [Sphingobium amiense]BBD99634.1 TetR/AcrR family transcriptional regulator [Sphingobium amiense]